MKKNKKILSVVLLILIMAGVAWFYMEATAVQLEPLRVSYIDVGQGDSALIKCGNDTMLIDAGPTDARETVVNYLIDEKITKISYLIATHPHADHIGGMAEVINQFDIDKIIMPKVQTDTKTFESMLDAIAEKNLKITAPNPGDTFMLGDAKVTILAPLKEYPDELNNSSIVLRIDHGQNSFLFTGDAESVVEKDLMAKGSVIEADVLKVGHHGSHTSSKNKFIKAVAPKYAVISAGVNNSYNHPSEEVLEILANNNVSISNTNERGTIIFISDGKRLAIVTKEEEAH